MIGRRRPIRRLIGRIGSWIVRHGDATRRSDGREKRLIVAADLFPLVGDVYRPASVLEVIAGISQTVGDTLALSVPSTVDQTLDENLRADLRIERLVGIADEFDTSIRRRALVVVQPGKLNIAATVVDMTVWACGIAVAPIPNSAARACIR